MRRVGVTGPGSRLCFGLLVLSGSASSTTAAAQVAPPAPEGISFGDYVVVPVAEARIRGEYWHDLDDADRGVLLERFRLGAEVQRGALALRVVFQDARLWDLGAAGGLPQQPPDVVGHPAQEALTAPYEGWIEAHTPGAGPSFVRLGRQAVEWGEGRLLGIADWSPTGRSLDAIRGRLVRGDMAFELLGANLADTTATTALTPSLIGPSYGELVGARFEWAFDPLFALEAYGLARFAQANPLLSLEGSVMGQTYTPALRLHGEGRGWTWGAEGAYQLGHADAVSGGEDRGAWAASGHIAYALQHVVLDPAIRVGVAYAGGDNGSSTYRAFDPLFPDVHTPFTGAMDLFAWSNEEEAHGQVSISPWSDAEATLGYRYTQLAQPGGAWRSAYLELVAVDPKNTARALGHEIDAILTWTPWPPLDLTLGYSALILGDGAKDLLAAAQLGTLRSDGTVSPPSVAQFAYAQASMRIP